MIRKRSERHKGRLLRLVAVVAAVHVFDPESGAAVGPGIQSAVPDAG